MRLSASVEESPARIHLNWPNEGDGNSYTISRRTLDSGWQELSTVGGDATSFSDANVQSGIAYEYRVVKTTSRTYRGYGYLRSGIRVPSAEHRGTIILLIENSPANALGSELDRLQRDLVADGWTVVRRNVSMNDSPHSVKEMIRTIYQSDPSKVNALLLFGHVPVPYSGDISPDDHQNHRGAWPADVYYGELDGEWTDNSVNTITAEREANRNRPGDGKFDQSEIPGNVELMVGRVDFHNMTCFANKSNSRSEIDLLRQYLNKNHEFRMGNVAVERRALICDNFGDKGDDPIAGSAWRLFPGTVGNQNIQEVGWEGFLPAATSGSYLWSFASGGGSYYYSTGVGTSDDFALQDVKVVFSMFMGSYFGDWNNESNFLRAALGSGNILTASYSGFPQTLYFPMTLGEPIGYCIRLTQSNARDGLYPPWGQGSKEVHIALHGDPTLRMHPVKPATGLTASSASGGVRLTWNASPDSNLVGYHVYRGANAAGPFTRITAQPVNETSFLDSPPPLRNTYMVRAIKLESTPSGTYLNPSLGIVAPAASNPTPQPPATPILQGEAAAYNSVNLRWNDVANETSYRIERRNGAAWAEITSAAANVTTFSDQGLAGATEYFYRIRALNDAGASGYSAEVRILTPPAPQPQSTVTFIEQDVNTAGNWPSKFGRDGSSIAGQANALPFEADFNGASTFTWEANTIDSRALLSSPLGTSRSATAWYGDPIDIDISTGNDLRRIALYLVDWDRNGRAQSVKLTDAATGVVMDARDVSDFGAGRYLVYDVRGNVRITIERIAGANALLQGIFAGGPVPTTNTDEPLFLQLRRAGSSALVVTISGDPGQRFRLESSRDCRTWTEVTSSALSTTFAEIQVPLNGSGPIFLRTVNMR